MTEVKLSDGTVVHFEKTSRGGAFEAEGVRDDVETSLARVSEVGSQVLREAMTKMRATLSDLAPDEIELEVGISVSHTGSVVITSGTAEANMKIKATWRAQTGE